MKKLSRTALSYSLPALLLIGVLASCKEKSAEEKFRDEVDKQMKTMEKEMDKGMKQFEKIMKESDRR